MKNLFRLPYDHFSAEGTIKCYFDMMYNDGLFVDCIESLVKKQSYMTDNIYCFFPDMDSYDESEHFEGVEFTIGNPDESENTIRVSEEVCYSLLKEASQNYIQYHPENEQKIENILKNLD